MKEDFFSKTHLKIIIFCAITSLCIISTIESSDVHFLVQRSIEWFISLYLVVLIGIFCIKKFGKEDDYKKISSTINSKIQGNGNYFLIIYFLGIIGTAVFTLNDSELFVFSNFIIFPLFMFAVIIGLGCIIFLLNYLSIKCFNTDLSRFCSYIKKEFKTIKGSKKVLIIDKESSLTVSSRDFFIWSFYYFFYVFLTATSIFQLLTRISENGTNTAIYLSLASPILVGLQIYLVDLHAKLSIYSSGLLKKDPQTMEISRLGPSFNVNVKAKIFTFQFIALNLLNAMVWIIELLEFDDVWLFLLNNSSDIGLLILFISIFLFETMIIYLIFLNNRDDYIKRIDDLVTNFGTLEKSSLAFKTIGQ